MASSRRYLAVVPAWNEALTIGTVLDGLRDRAPAFDVLVVDDGSTDETAEIAQERGARVVRLPFNLGIGGAVQAGFQFAQHNGYDYLVQVDGDGQHDPCEIETLLRVMHSDPVVD